MGTLTPEDIGKLDKAMSAYFAAEYKVARAAYDQKQNGVYYSYAAGNKIVPETRLHQLEKAVDAAAAPVNETYMTWSSSVADSLRAQAREMAKHDANEQVDPQKGYSKAMAAYRGSISHKAVASIDGPNTEYHGRGGTTHFTSHQQLLDQSRAPHKPATAVDLKPFEQGMRNGIPPLLAGQGAHQQDAPQMRYDPKMWGQQPPAERHAPPAAERHAPPAAERHAPPATERHAPPAAERRTPPVAERQAAPAPTPTPKAKSLTGDLSGVGTNIFDAPDKQAPNPAKRSKSFLDELFPEISGVKPSEKPVRPPAIPPVSSELAGSPEWQKEQADKAPQPAEKPMQRPPAIPPVSSELAGSPEWQKEQADKARQPAPAKKPIIFAEKADQHLDVVQAAYDKRNDKAAMAKVEKFLTGKEGNGELDDSEKMKLNQKLLDPKFKKEVEQLGKDLGVKGVDQTKPVADSGHSAPTVTATRAPRVNERS